MFLPAAVLEQSRTLLTLCRPHNNDNEDEKAALRAEAKCDELERQVLAFEKRNAELRKQMYANR